MDIKDSLEAKKHGTKDGSSAPEVQFVSESEQSEIEELLKNPECHEIVETVTIEI